MRARTLRDDLVDKAWVAWVNVMDPDGKRRATGREWAALEAVVDALHPNAYMVYVMTDDDDY